MLKFASDLSDDHEYFILWTGQSTSRPWGTPAEAAQLFSEYVPEQVGVNLASIVIPADASRAALYVENLAIGTTLGDMEWSNTHLRLGTVTNLLKGYAQVLSNAAGFIRVRWITSPGVGAQTVSGYLIRIDYKWASRPEVRVLTPYQPVPPPIQISSGPAVFAEDTLSRYVPYPNLITDTFAGNGRGLTLPAPFVKPDAVTKFEDLGLLLDYTQKEGIAGFGISELSDSTATPSAHAITAIAGNEWTFANPLATDEILNYGNIIVDWEDGPGGPMKRSWNTIATQNAANKFTVSAVGWLGDGDPTAFGNVKRYTVWVPHFDDSPHSYLPGEGFTYPNNDMLPCYRGDFGNRGAVIKNRPRGAPQSCYGDYFGDMLVAASRLSAATGKRINVVMLGINASSLAPSTSSNTFAFRGIVGWWNYKDHLTWAPVLTTSAYQRIVKLITTILPNALLAEGNTKTPRFLGHVHCQGESDAIYLSMREHYGRTLKAFVTKVRNLITGLGYNPYANGAKLPFVQPKIAHVTYELVGTYQYYGIPFVFNGDAKGVVNSAIVEHAVADGFAENVYVDDLPRVLTDLGHYSGVGEAARGARIAESLGRLVDYAMSFGSPAQANPSTRIIDICNIALSHIGQSKIESLDEGSAQAIACKQLLPEARDTLLQARIWGFAKRRIQLVAIRRPDIFNYKQWDYCYPIPPEALNAFAVLPPFFEVSDFDTLRVLQAGYTAEFIANQGHADPVDESLVGTGDDLPSVPYEVEQSPHGGRYIFTQQKNATLRYVRRVIDAEAYSPAFCTALSWFLAAMLAEALIKGNEGEAVAKRCMQNASGAAGMAASSDARQRTPAKPFDQIPKHISDR